MIDADDFENRLTAAELSENTIRVYVAALRQYAEHYSEISQTNIRQFKKRYENHWKPETINLKLSAIAKYCEYEGLKVKINRIKVHRIHSVENVITEPEFRGLLEGLTEAGNERWRVNILVMARTGARISEAVRLTKADCLRGHVDMPTKGKTRRIYIPKGLVSDISDYLETLKPAQTVMQNYHGRPITPKGVNKMLKTLAERYDIPRSHMHPHSFRHFFAIEFLKRKNNISLLADILGHSSINTTMIYLRKSQEEQKKEIDEAVSW